MSYHFQKNEVADSVDYITSAIKLRDFRSAVFLLQSKILKQKVKEDYIQSLNQRSEIMRQGPELEDK